MGTIKIEAEYNNNKDEYSKEIILSHIDSILKYSKRFYKRKRQFLNRSKLSGKVINRFNEALRQYFDSNIAQTVGLPTIVSIAAQLNMSPHYLIDMLRQETGKSAIDHIHNRLISEAKHVLVGVELFVREIAYQLGFENPPYFSRLFRKKTGVTPRAYRKLN